MARLPVVSGDSNAWGTILNTFLSVALNANGSLKLMINVKDAIWGAAGDGVTDDSTAIAAARSAANAAGGGLVFYPPGIYLTGILTLYSNVHDVGAGIEATTLKLKNGANSDLFSGQTNLINLAAAYNSSGSGVDTGLSNFSIENMTIDGNLANQTAGPSYPIRFYGYNFRLVNLIVKNGYTGGILTDWNGGAFLTSPSNEMESVIDTCKIHENNGIGLEMGGPHDSRMLNTIIFSSQKEGLHIAPNAVGLISTNCHYYKTFSTTDPQVLVEGGYCSFYNCLAEGSSYGQVVFLSNNCLWNGLFYGSGFNNYGIVLGQNAGQTPYYGEILQSAGLTTAAQAAGCSIFGVSTGCQNGALNFVNEANNTIILNDFVATGVYLAGTPATNDSYWIRGNGLTPDGSLAKGGGFQMAAQNSQAFSVFNNAGVRVLSLNTQNNGFTAAGGSQINICSDNAGSVKQLFMDGTNGNLQINGTLAVGPSASAPDPGAGGTVATDSVGMARVNPSGGSRTGCILAAGSRFASQEIWVVNEHATNTITWATQATSHIAGATGSNFILAGDGAQKFVWDSSVSLWFKAS